MTEAGKAASRQWGDVRQQLPLTAAVALLAAAVIWHGSTRPGRYIQPDRHGGQPIFILDTATGTVCTNVSNKYTCQEFTRGGKVVEVPRDAITRRTGATPAQAEGNPFAQFDDPTRSKR